MTTEMTKDKITDSQDYDVTYTFGITGTYEGLITNDYIKEECKRLGIPFNEEGLNTIRERFGDFDSESYERHDYIRLYHHLYLKLVRDSFGISENMMIFENDLWGHHLIGKINENTVLMSGYFILNSLLESEKSIPHPDEFQDIFKKYIEIYESFNGSSNGQYFLYDCDVLPFNTNRIPDEVLKEINSFLDSEV